MSYQQPIKIGFHVKSMGELERLSSLPGVNLVELKPDYFPRKESPELYTYENGIFRINEPVAKDISELASERGLQVQIHLPFPREVNIDSDRGLCQAIPEHHERILNRYRMLGDLLGEYGIGEVVTVHPPAYIISENKVAKKGDAIEIGRRLYEALSSLIINEGYQFEIGIENMVEPKEGRVILGFTGSHVGHLKQLLGETGNIGLTVDTGHRKLSKYMSIKGMFAMGKVVNYHFHSNPGVSPNGSGRDKHELATPENLEAFKRHTLSIKRWDLPVVLEISGLEKIPDEVLIEYISQLRGLVDSKKTTQN